MKKKEDSQCQLFLLPYLSEEIITNILTRLPVKTLIKFKCVSKSWLNLISDPNFIKTHLLNASKSFHFTHHKIIVWHKIPQKDSYYLKSCSLDSLFSPPFNYGHFSNGHSLQLDFHSNRILGSCNGLVCILMERTTFLIWNSSTGKSKTLSILDKSLHHSTFGFCYDQLNDDYKVVQVQFDLSSRKIVVNLYSLRTNSWKIIGDFPKIGGSSLKTLFVNGALHWTVWDLNGSFTPSCCRIVSLDLGNETYGEIEPPDYGGYRNCSSDLIVLEGCISMCYNIEGVRADIWVMKEYGIRDSWVKLYTLPHMPKVHVFLHRVLFRDSVTGEILLQHDNELTIYHPKDFGIFTSKRIENILGLATSYLESLVSP